MSLGDGSLVLVLALASEAWITISAFDWNKLANETHKGATSYAKDIKFICNDISPHQPPLQATKGDKGSWDTFKEWRLSMLMHQFYFICN